MKEQRWVRRWKSWISPTPVLPGVFKRKEGGFLCRGRARDPRTGRLRDIKMTFLDTHAATAFERLQVELKKVRSGMADEVKTKIRLKNFAVSLVERKVELGELKSAKSREKWSANLIHHLLPTFGDFYIDTIRRADIETWKSKMASKVKAGSYSPRTVNDWLATLRVIINAAVSELELNRSAAANATGAVDVPDSDKLSPKSKKTGRGRNIGAEGRVGDNRAVSKPHEKSGGAQAVANAANNRGKPDPELVKEFEDWSTLVKSIDDLVVIHNPDQVAGGPGQVQGIPVPPDVDEEKTNNSDVWIEYVKSLKKLYGPKAVNETIGKGWDTNINSLQENITAAIPAESHALHQMDITLKPGPI